MYYIHKFPPFSAVLPLIFSGPYEKTNSTFPYSGNLSSVQRHNVKIIIIITFWSINGYEWKNIYV